MEVDLVVSCSDTVDLFDAEADGFAGPGLEEDGIWCPLERRED